MSLPTGPWWVLCRQLLHPAPHVQVFSCWVGEFVGALLSFHHRGSTQLLLASEAKDLLPPLLSFMHAQVRLRCLAAT